MSSRRNGDDCLEISWIDGRGGLLLIAGITGSLLIISKSGPVDCDEVIQNFKENPIINRDEFKKVCAENGRR